MKTINSGLLFRHPVGEWRAFCGLRSRALGGPVVFAHLWERRA